MYSAANVAMIGGRHAAHDDIELTSETVCPRRVRLYAGYCERC
jgi:hypothetical protein